MVLPFIHVEYMNVRLAAGKSPQDQVALVEDTWREISGGIPMEWTFLDNRINQLYQSEQRLSRLFGIYAVVAVLLACIGLYGIVMFMINKRLKELGIRKILGASFLSIYSLFAKPYAYQIFIAMVITIPLLHHYLDNWLSNFAYRIEIAWWSYPLSALLLATVALLTITIRLWMAARINPVNLLRSE
jgi:putative ABC transport system permease protein